MCISGIISINTSQGKAEMEKFKLPAQFDYRIISAGRYNLYNKAFLNTYNTRDNTSLHMYEYPGVLKINDETFEFSPGAISIIPPHNDYRYDMPHEGYHYCIHFFIEYPKSCTEFIEVPVFHQLKKNYEIEIMKTKIHDIIFYNSMNDNLSGKDFASKVTFLQMLCFIALELCAPVSSAKSEALKAVQQAAALIEANLHKNISIPAIAAKVGLSQNYLAKFFKESYGKTLSQFYIEKRIELAAFLLCNSDLKIKQIGKRCGLPDPQYFNKVFRKFKGMSPSEMRRS